MWHTCISYLSAVATGHIGAYLWHKYRYILNWWRRYPRRFNCSALYCSTLSLYNFDSFFDQAGITRFVIYSAVANNAPTSSQFISTIDIAHLIVQAEASPTGCCRPCHLSNSILKPCYIELLLFRPCSSVVKLYRLVTNYTRSPRCCSIFPLLCGTWRFLYSAIAKPIKIDICVLTMACPRR